MKERISNGTFEYAEQMDQQDELSLFRDEFYLKKGTIYLDGNSLGLVSKRAEKSLLELFHSWKDLMIDGWMEGRYPWFNLSEQLGAKCAPLIGAHPEEVIITGSTTSNLHQIVSSFYHPTGNKTKILADELTFPSDLYALQSQISLKGYNPEHHLVLVKSKDGKTIEEDDVIAAMTEEIALIVLPSVLYRSGQVLNIEQLTREAHKRNILIGFDLCHSIGAIPHELTKWDADFAVWCNYKYLNAGPGSVGGLFVNKKHFSYNPGLAGWFSSDKSKQFDMDNTLTTADGIGKFQIGTPHILSLAPLIGSLDLFEEAGIGRLRKKSLQLTKYFIDLVETQLRGYHFTIGNPIEDNRRGGHILIEHKEAARICKALKANGIVPDFRVPNGIRLAPVPLYNTFTEVWEAVQMLKKIMEQEEYKQFTNTREVVA
ncbi:MAG: kynureninase [Bacillus sp. (in: firmicutes)]